MKKMKQTLNNINGGDNAERHISGRQSLDNMFGSGRSFILMKYFYRKLEKHASLHAGRMSFSKTFSEINRKC